MAEYSRLTGEDEEGTHRRLSEYLDLIADAIRRHAGRVVHYAGDAVLADFPTASEVLTCAAAVQRDLEERNADLPEERRIRFRIGVNLGEVIVDRNDIYGAGVNVAARLETLAEPGGICVSESVRNAVGGRLPLGYDFLGEQTVKNIEEPVRAYRVRVDPEVALPAPSVVGKRAGRVTRRTAAAITVGFVLAVAGVLTWLEPWAPKIEAASVERMAFPLPDKPSIAVLPFDNLAGSQEQEYLADGFTENIITELSRFKKFFVIARNSVFAYKGEPVKVQQVAEELGVRYVVEGSVQTAGDKVRVTAQLIDALTGRHIWAERFDRRLQDIFSVQDEITRTVAATLEQNIDLAEYERVRRKPTEKLNAYEHVKRGFAEWFTFTQEGNQRAKRLFEKARALDPSYSEAYIGLAWVHINGYRFGWSESHSPEESLGLALENAERAVELDPFKPKAHQALANAMMQSGDLDQAIEEYNRALELNPNSANVLADSAEPLMYLGRAQEAVSRMETAIRLNPRHPDWYLWNLGAAQYFARQYENSLSSLRKMNKMPNGARRTLAAVLVRLGRLEEARTVISEFRENAPDYTLQDVRMLPFKHTEYLKRYIEDLRKAGMPKA